ncbi:hypothetical protein DL95DRAFT_395852 [Leptodontidium sp. 2 PMI_412]|nr:hypothetical protein DL95DRAFT_395852 [Leptodontidium sp. 2 PMI_412]
MKQDVDRGCWMFGSSFSTPDEDMGALAGLTAACSSDRGLFGMIVEDAGVYLVVFSDFDGCGPVRWVERIESVRL